ncbi:uncharacterized protein LOC144101618 [Amblyomma americanum]
MAEGWNAEGAYPLKMKTTMLTIVMASLNAVYRAAAEEEVNQELAMLEERFCKLSTADKKTVFHCVANTGEQVNRPGIKSALQVYLDRDPETDEENGMKELFAEMCGTGTPNQINKEIQRLEETDDMTNEMAEFKAAFDYCFKQAEGPQDSSD